MASDLVYAAEKQPSRVEDITQSQNTPGQLTRPARSLVDHPSQLLHPIDTGVHAWLFVFSSFTLEFFVWGFAFSYGVFQEWFLTHPPFDSASEASINAIGTITLGLQYCLGLVSVFIVRQYAGHVRLMMISCLVASTLALFTSSFATRIWHLIILQGVVNGTAGGIMYPTVMLWLPDWFDKRRNLASSLIQAGSAIGGIIFPLIISTLLQRIGYSWTMRAFSISFGILATPAVFSVKPRIPLASHRTRSVSQSSSDNEKVPQTVVHAEGNKSAPKENPVAPISTAITGADQDVERTDWSYIRSPIFLCVNFAVFIQGLGHFSASFYVTTFAVAIGHSRLQGTIALSVFNAALLTGQVLTGHWCDEGGKGTSSGNTNSRYPGVMIVTTVLQIVVALGMWGTAGRGGYALMLMYALCFGALSGSFLAIWTPAATDAAGSDGSPFVLLLIFKGLSAVVGPMIASSLHPKGSLSASAAACSNRDSWGPCGFRGMIIFVAATMAGAATLSTIVKILHRHRLLERRRASHPADPSAPIA